MNLKFYSTAYPKFGEEDFVARISGEATTERELLDELYVKLKFPEYFGFNWDALNDCLSDFSWIDNYKIILIHENLPKLQGREMFIYLDILNDVIQDWINWQNGKVHSLEVYFRENDRLKIENILNNYSL